MSLLHMRTAFAQSRQSLRCSISQTVDLTQRARPFVHSTNFRSKVLFQVEEICQRTDYLGRVKRIWYLSPMRAAKVQARLRGCAGSPEPSLLA